MPDSMKSMMLCGAFGAGIIVMLGLYGFIQEKVMTVEYDGELFKFTVFLVLCNRLFAILFSGGMIVANKEDAAPKCPLWKYFAISISNVAATTCQYEALKWVSFPVQMLGKSFKMMPVMVWGILISQKSYKLQDWLIAFDGFTSTFQEKLFKDHTTTKYNQMLYVNLFSSITSVLTLVISGGFMDAFAFCAAHPRFML